MENHTDEDLALRFQAGERGACNEIVDRYWELSNLVAREYAIAGVEIDDRHMEAIQGLLKAAQGWKPGKGSKFKTFAKMAMRRRMIDIWRDRNQRRKVPASRLLSLDAPIGAEDGEAGTFGDMQADPLDVFDEVERRIYAEAAASDVLRAHKEVLFGVAQDYEHAEIAAFLGINAEYIAGVMRFNRAVGAVFEAKNAA